MADVTGALHHDFHGRAYTLRLTLGGLANLQGRYGNDLGGLLSGGITGVPPFGLLLDIVTEALIKGEKMDRDDAADLADEIQTADRGVAIRLIEAAFPPQTNSSAGNRAAPRQRKS